MNKKVVYHTRMEDANFYLQGSLVKWCGEVVKVLYVESNGLVAIQRSVGQTMTTYANLDLTPIELGYVFSPSRNEAVYLERLPNRQWRQGLTQSSITTKNAPYRQTDIEVSVDYIARLSKRRFPSVSKAQRVAIKKHTTIPFHKHYAVDYNGLVYYKTKMVGSYSRKSLEVSVLEPYSFLSNEIEEVIT